MRSKPAYPRPSTRGLVTTLLGVAALALAGLVSPWALSAFLIVGCGVCVAFEFALVKIPVRALERDMEEGVRGAALAHRMKQEMNAMLAACQFGITLTSLGLTLALEPAIHHALARFEELAAYSVALAMGAGALLHVTFGELVPKGLALVVPRRVLYATAPFMYLFRILAVPFIKTCNAVANAAVQALTGKNPDKDAHHEEGMEIGEALVYAHASGELKPEQLRMMQNTLGFYGRTAREVMTPARYVVSLDLRDGWEANLRKANESDFSRCPVIDGSWFDVVGYVRHTDLLKAELSGSRDLRALLRPINKRPETVSLGRLDLFSGSPMVACYDEHDTFTGLLTSEDVVEQIVGEIYDEADVPEQSGIERLEGGSVRVSGSLLLKALHESLQIDDFEPPGDVDTVGGLVIKLLGRLPRVGDEVDIGGYRARVEAAQGFRVKALLLTRRGAAEPAKGGP